MLTRTQSKAQAAIDEIKKQNPKAIVQFIPFDLTSIASCKKAAAEFLSKEERLDILINNAGAVRHNVL
jgi:short-subunit dehydrogenase